MVQIPSINTAAKTTGPGQIKKIIWIDLIERNRDIYGRSKITLRLAGLKRVTFDVNFDNVLDLISLDLPSIREELVKTEIIIYNLVECSTSRRLYKNVPSQFLGKSLSLAVAIKLAWVVEVILQLFSDRRRRLGGGGLINSPSVWIGLTKEQLKICLQCSSEDWIHFSNFMSLFKFLFFLWKS